MRFVLFILFLSSVASVQAQTLRFDSEVHDFGIIKPGETRKTEFRFVNGGRDTLVLLDPRPSCGCTAAMLSDYVLAPGDSGSIRVDFRAVRGMYGPTTKTISMFGQGPDGESRLALLRINANVVGQVSVEPSAMRFRSLIGETDTMRLLLRSEAETPLPMTNITASLLALVDTSEGNAYHVDQVQSEPFTSFELHIGVAELLPGDSTEILLVVHPLKKGQVSGMLRIALPRSELRIPVTGVVLRN